MNAEGDHVGVEPGALSLRRLRYFVAVAEELHFGRAAERLQMAQPPLSKQIRVLEHELGLELFERSTRRVSLTTAGEILFDEARHVLAAAHGAERVMRAYRSGEGGVLRLGFVDSSAYVVMPRLLREYRERWPQVRYELRSLSSDQQIEALTHGEIDLGIGRTAGDGHAVEATRVLVEPLFIAVGAGHRLESRPSVRLDELAGEAFLGFDHRISPSLHAELVVLFGRAGLGYEPFMEAAEYTTIVGLVAAGAGIAVVPASVRGFQPEGVSYLPIDDRTAEVSLLLLTRPSEHLPLVQRALDLAGELFA